MLFTPISQKEQIRGCTSTFVATQVPRLEVDLLKILFSKNSKHRNLKENFQNVYLWTKTPSLLKLWIKESKDNRPLCPIVGIRHFAWTERQLREP